MNTLAIKIVSGGQTGADRAALDFAIEHGIAHGGWCPKGRPAEDGTIDPRYKLQVTPSSDYVQRTEWNVRDSDGSVVFSIAAALTGGSKETVERLGRLKRSLRVQYVRLYRAKSLFALQNNAPRSTSGLDLRLRESLTPSVWRGVRPFQKRF